MGIVPAWSFSTKQEFDSCPYKLHHRYVLKSPKPPLDPDSPLERGVRIHKLAENYMNQSEPLPAELASLQDLFFQAKVQIETTSFATEDNWAFDKNWASVDWYAPDVWVRMSADLQIDLEGKETTIVDYKTGKKDGNELKHMAQGQLYTLGAFLKNPTLDKVTVQFWYVDQGKHTSRTWKRPQMERFLSQWTAIGEKITSATNLPPKPNKFTCRYCDYCEVCEFAIREGDL